MNIRIFALPILIVMGALALQGCAPPPAKPQPALPAEREARPEPSKEEREVLESLRAAYSLEGRLWDQRMRMRTREDLESFFREGFCEEPARLLAEHFWLGPEAPGEEEGPQLRVGEPMLTLPEEPVVEEVGPEHARVRLDYPPVDTGPLTSPAQSVTVILRREDGIWKVCAIEGPGENPPGVPRSVPRSTGSWLSAPAYVGTLAAIRTSIC